MENKIRRFVAVTAPLSVGGIRFTPFGVVGESPDWREIKDYIESLTRSAVVAVVTPDDQEFNHITGLNWESAIVFNEDGSPSELEMPTYPSSWTLHSDEADGSTETRLFHTKLGFDTARIAIMRDMANRHPLLLEDGGADIITKIETGDIDDAWEIFQEANVSLNAVAGPGEEDYYHAEAHY